MNIFNWFFVPIALAFGIMTSWWSFAILATALDSVLPGSWILYPKWQHTAVTSLLLCLAGMIGSTATVLLSAMSAPKYKKETAHLALILGAVVSAFMLGSILSWAIFLPVYLATIGAGICSVLFLKKVL